MPTAPFLATKTADRIDAYWWADIEGLRVRYGSIEPSWNPADSGTNRPIKPWMTDLPVFGAHSVEPLDGSSEPYQFDIVILDEGDALTALFANYSTTAIRTSLISDPGVAGTNLEVSASGGFAIPSDIYVERETMRATAAPDGTHLTVTRGMYGSKAVAHPRTDSDNNQRDVEVADVPPFIVGRKIVLYENRTGLVEADAIKFYGYVDDVPVEKIGAYGIKASGMLSKLSKSLGQDAQTTKLKYALGHPWMNVEDYHSLPLYDPGVSKYPWEHAMTTWCIYVYDSTKFPASATIRVGDEIMHYDAKKAASTNVIELDSSFDGVPNATVDWMFKHNTLKGRGMFSNELFGPYRLGGGGEGAGGGLIGDNDLRLVNLHMADSEVRLVVTHKDFTAGTDPISIILQILQSSGDPAANGNYDKLPATFGCDIHEDDIDVAGFEAAREKYCAEQDLHFCISEPVEAKKWLEEGVLRPFLFFLRETPDGKIGIGRLLTRQEVSQDSTVISLTTDDLGEMPANEKASLPLGEFEWKINFDPGSREYLGTIRVVMGNTGELIGNRARKFSLKCPTCYDYRVTGSDGSGRGGQHLGMADMISEYIAIVWDRFANSPMPKLSIVVPYNRLADIEIGDALKITCAGVANSRTGARGINSEPYQVVEIRPLPADSAAELLLWQVGVNDANYRAIAPAAKVASYNAGTQTATLTPGVFESSGNAADQFATVDLVILLNSEYEPLAGVTPELCSIDDIGHNWIQFADPPATPPAAGDYIVTAKYDNQHTTQKAKWASLADSGGLLGTANDEGHVRQ